MQLFSADAIIFKRRKFKKKINISAVVSVYYYRAFLRIFRSCVGSAI